jgi:hypothetical protein
LFPRRVFLEIQDRALTALALEGRSIAWCETLPLPEGILVAGHPQQVQARGDLIGDWLIERGYAGARLRAVLPWAASDWRWLRRPASAAGQPLAELAVRELGPEAFGAPLEQLDLGLYPCEGAAPALLVGARTDLLEDWIAVFAQAGLVLDGLEAAAICCARAAAAAGFRLVLCAETHQSWLLLVHEGLPRWQCPLPGLGQDADLSAALEPCVTHVRRLDRTALASPWGLMASGGCGSSLKPLLTVLQSAASAGVELIDPVVRGDWSWPSDRPGLLPSSRLGLLWGLGMTELGP